MDISYKLNKIKVIFILTELLSKKSKESKSSASPSPKAFRLTEPPLSWNPLGSGGSSVVLGESWGVAHVCVITGNGLLKNQPKMNNIVYECK